MDIKQILFLLAAVALLCGVGTANGQESEFFKAVKIKAEQGDAKAQNRLGSMYYIGKGVPKDEVEAHVWLLLAKANRDEEDSKAVSSLEKLLTAELIEKGQARAAELHRLIEQKSAE